MNVARPIAHSHVERKHRVKRIAAATYWRTDEDPRACEAEYKRILREARYRGW
jgi:hypothetical protein